MNLLDWISDLSRTDQIGWLVTILVLIAIAIYGTWQSHKGDRNA